METKSYSMLSSIIKEQQLLLDDYGVVGVSWWDTSYTYQAFYERKGIETVIAHKLAAFLKNSTRWINPNDLCFAATVRESQDGCLGGDRPYCTLRESTGEGWILEDTDVLLYQDMQGPLRFFSITDMFFDEDIQWLVFNKYSADIHKEFYGLVDRKGKWFNSAESLESAMDLVPMDCTPSEQKGVSIVHSDRLRFLYEAGLIT